MRKKNRHYNLIKHVLCGLLAGSLTLSNATFPLKAQSIDEVQNSFDTETSNLLTLQTETTDGNLIRPYLTDSSGERYTDQSNEQANSPVTQFRTAASLPSSYDLRTLNLITSIKDQGITGCCWAFAAIKSMESNALKKGLASSADTTDFSESHLTWFSYNPSANPSDPLYNDGITVSGSGTNPFSPNNTQVSSASNTYAYENGGSAILAIFSLAKWGGPISESLAPFTASTTEEMNAMASSMSQNAQPLRYSSELHLQNAFSYDEITAKTSYYYNNSSAVSEMKSAIMEYGAMDIAFYYDSSFLNATASDETSYYQRRYSGTNAVNAANHCVTIVGWDDNYSKKNFQSTPSGNGAWLIANSYGTKDGDSGYFWMSYYEPSICDCYVFDTESASNYDNIYQYDGFGWGQALGSSNGNLRAGNIFTATDDSPQKICSVSFYTLTRQQRYRIQIYRDVPANASKPTDGVLISDSTTTGTAAYNGYHTVALSTPVTVNAGERFAVVVTYIQSGSTTAYLPFEGANETSSSYNLSYSSSEGQSFIFNKWYGSTGEWMDSSSLGYNNVCVKAFTQNTESSSKVPVISVSDSLKLGSSKIILGKGESVRLSNSSALSYSSQDSSIVSVNSSGKITGKKVGSTKITVSNSSSQKTLTMTVKKAPTKIRITQGKKKTIKKGKSFVLKTKLPAGSASYKLTFSSSKKKVANVTAQGKVKAKKKGTVNIKVKTYNNKTAKLKLIVK